MPARRAFHPSGSSQHTKMPARRAFHPSGYTQRTKMPAGRAFHPSGSSQRTKMPARRAFHPSGLSQRTKMPARRPARFMGCPHIRAALRATPHFHGGAVLALRAPRDAGPQTRPLRVRPGAQRPHSPSPCRPHSPSPCRPHSPSPCRPHSPSPCRPHSPSPCRPHSPSPCRPHSPSPCRPPPSPCRPHCTSPCRPHCTSPCRPHSPSQCRAPDAGVAPHGGRATPHFAAVLSRRSMPGSVAGHLRDFGREVFALGFSMPSPRSKRTKPDELRPVPTALATSRSGRRSCPSRSRWLLEQADSPSSTWRACPR